MTAPLVFFLGGRDLEMLEIARLVSIERGAHALVDREWAWGASLAPLAREIEATVAAGARAVGVELSDDMPADWPARRGLTLVDHHGTRAGEASSLRQVFSLLDLPPSRWTRRLNLVEANDVDHIKGLFAAGASLAEAKAVRVEDRAAQGIDPDQEAAGLAALSQAAMAFGGALHIVQPPHARMACVMDPLAFALWPRLPEALVLAPGETDFYGRGTGVMAMDAAFPGGWRGGHLPENGFWGFAGAGAPGGTAALAALAPVFWRLRERGGYFP